MNHHYHTTTIAASSLRSRDHDSDDPSENSISGVDDHASTPGDGHHRHSASNFDPGLHQNEKEELLQISRIAQKETRNLWLWKVALVGLMLTTAGLVSAGTYMFINDAQEKDFVDGVRYPMLFHRFDFSVVFFFFLFFFVVAPNKRDYFLSFSIQYEQFTDTIRNAMSFHIDNIISSHRLLSEHITATAIATNQTWPFVTIPHLEVEASYCRQTSGAEVLSVAPIVAQKDIARWGVYSVEHQNWLQESRAIIRNSGRAGTLSLSSYVEGNIFPLIYEAADAFFSLPIPAVNPPVAPVWYVTKLKDEFSNS
jgi:hypothetical protein